MTTHRDRTRATKAENLPEIDLEEKPQTKKRRCLICDYFIRQLRTRQPNLPGLQVERSVEDRLVMPFPG